MVMERMKSVIFLILFVLPLSSGSLFAASFDCGKAKSFAEKTICSDEKLSGDDELLAKVYSVAKKVAHNQKGFNGLTKDLWNARERCTDYKCVNDWYGSAFVVYDSVIRSNASDDVLNNIQRKYNESTQVNPSLNNGNKNKTREKDFSLYDSKERAAPIEHNAVLYKETPDAFEFIDTLVGFVRQSSYKCDTVSSFIPMVLSNGFTLACNKFSYKYEIKNNGGNISVTVDN